MKYVTSVYVSPDSIELEEGTWYYGATATVFPSDADNQKVGWFSVNPSIAGVNPTNGYIYANSEGTTFVCAVAADGSECCDCIAVTVLGEIPVESVELDYSGISIERGNRKTLSATVCPENASDQSLSWTSSDPQVATVDDGVVTAVSNGTAVITATACDGSGKSASCTVTVTGNVLVTSIEVEPSTPLVRYGNTLLLHRGKSVVFRATVLPTNATNKTVTWRTSDHCVATVNPTNGYVYGKATGDATIYAWATDGSRVIGYVNIKVIIPTESVSVTPSYQTLAAGETLTLSATVSPANASIKSVRWSSNKSSVATVNANGVVTAGSDGVATIRAESADGNTFGSCEVRVNAAATKYYHIVNKANGKVVNINGANLTSLTDGRNITLYSPTESNEQIWRIDAIRENENCFIRSYIDEDYGFNAYKAPTDNYQCNIHMISGNETDAAVHFVAKGNGYYQIELANYPGYKLTATGENDGSDIRWQTADRCDLQLWRLESVEIEPDPSEVPVEYHIIPVANETMALYANGSLLERLDEDTSVILKGFSYMNRQKWTIQGSGTSAKLYSRHGDNFVLCKNGDGSNQVIVSDHATEDNSNLTFEQQNSGTNVYQIKLTNSNLYLTVTGDTVIWDTRNTSGNSQDWELREKPANIRNGCDTDKFMTSLTIKTMKRNGKQFAVRYYGMLNSVKNVELKTIELKNGNEVSVVDRTINNLKDVGINLDIDSLDYSQYLDSITEEDVSFALKNLTSSEISYLRENNINIVTVYQNFATKIDYFTEDHAKLDAFCALISAKILGQPEGTAIYFGVDFDPGNNWDQIEEYFDKVKQIINGKYKIGVYGFGKVCNRIKQVRGYATYSWLGHAAGTDNYGGYDDVTKYNMKQAERIKYNEIVFDHDTAVGDDYGQW